MTEAEWWNCEDPTPMLKYLPNIQSKRKFMLFAHACCCRLLDLLPQKESREAVDLLGLYADGAADDSDLHRAERAMSKVHRRIKHPNKRDAARAVDNACMVLNFVGPNWFVASIVADHARKSREAFAKLEGAVQGRIIRDIFGNPFRHALVEPTWLTWSDSTILKLANGIHDERAFDRLPILADALEDAGCDNADILNHCRSGGEHVRGCWVVDLLLGKE